MSLIIKAPTINERLKEEILQLKYDLLFSLLLEGRAAEVDQEVWKLYIASREKGFKKRGPVPKDNFSLAEEMYYEFKILRQEGLKYEDALSALAGKNGCMGEKNVERLVTAFRKHQRYWDELLDEINAELP